MGRRGTTRVRILLLLAARSAALDLGALLAPRRAAAAPALASLGALQTKGLCAWRWAADEAHAEAVLAPIAAAFDALALHNPEALRPELAPAAAGTRLAADGAHGFHCYAAGTTRAMRWLYAADGATLDLFRGLADACRAPMEASVAAAGWEPPAGAPGVALSAASFISIVGARAGITDDIARWHEDWGPCADHEAFSVLLPLRRVDAAARRAYRLEYRAWDAPARVGVYDYALGAAAVVDGRAPHRTAPFSAADLARATPAGERVLVCLNFASTDPRARDAQEAVMRSQTPGFFDLPGVAV